MYTVLKKIAWRCESRASDHEDGKRLTYPWQHVQQPLASDDCVFTDTFSVHRSIDSVARALPSPHRASALMHRHNLGQ